VKQAAGASITSDRGTERSITAVTLWETAMPVTLRLVTTADELGRLQAAWAALIKQSTSATPFATWEWMTAWWRVHTDRGELAIAEVRRRGALIGIVPLYRAPIHWWGVGLWSLRFIGDGTSDSDYLDAICIPGEESTVAWAVCGWLHRSPAYWDVWALNGTPEASPTIPAIRQAADAYGFGRIEEWVSCASIDLPITWEAYERSLSPRMRTKTRSLLRRLAARHHMRLEVGRTVEEVSQRLMSLFELHTRRWNGKGLPGAFADPKRRRFYDEIGNTFGPLDRVRLYSLLVDDEPVAHEFCVRDGATMFLLQEAFDPRWADEGVGNILRAIVLRECIEAGLKSYDFLEGASFHKASWGARTKRSLRMTLVRRCARNRALLALLAAARHGARKIGPALPRVGLGPLRHAVARVARPGGL
jgi:CelD/BcsL family acetyltransferase involved in cellulose biosynthesis